MPNRAQTDHAGEREPRFSWLTSVILTGVISFCSVFALSACGQGEGGVPGVAGGEGGTDNAPGVSVGMEPGTAELNWAPPTTNEDGTPLDDLAGYRIYYGTASPLDKGTSQSVDVGNSKSVTLSGFSTGTYFFAATAYDASGNESGLSEEVSKVFAGT